MDQRLDLEAVAPQPPVALVRGGRGDVEVQHRYVLLPEHVEAVAQVRVARSMAEIDHLSEQAVTELAQACDVAAAAARGEPRSLCEVRAAQQRLHELRDLARIRRAVRIHHGYYIAGGGFESAGERVPLTPASLLHHLDVGP